MSCPSHRASNDSCNDDDAKNDPKEDPKGFPSHATYPVFFRLRLCNDVVDICWFPVLKRRPHCRRGRSLKALQFLLLTAGQYPVMIESSLLSHV